MPTPVLYDFVTPSVLECSRSAIVALALMSPVVVSSVPLVWPIVAVVSLSDTEMAMHRRDGGGAFAAALDLGLHVLAGLRGQRQLAGARRRRLIDQLRGRRVLGVVEADRDADADVLAVRAAVRG